MEKSVLKDVDKAWVCVIIDMYMGAISLELVENLTPEAFISMFKRFVGERGLPKFVYCDNATTFIGATRMIKKAEEKLSPTVRAAINASEKEIQRQFTELEVTFLYDESDVLIIDIHHL